MRRRVITARGCWEWQGARLPKGYGLIAHHSDAGLMVHRVAAHLWLDFDLADPQRVLHRCDNPPCFNPEHLWLGTIGDNQADMAAKQRAPNRKLTVEDVREIKAVLTTGARRPGLAAKYRVSKRTIQNIRLGRIYRWVT